MIGIFGGSRRDENSALYAEAYELGQALARAGYVVLNGGYGGSMAAVSRGAAEAGGRVIGVTCAIFDPLLPNQWVSEEIKLPDMIARLRVLMERSDSFVALRGGIGTLAELTLAWSLLQTRTFGGKHLLLLGDDWQAVVDALGVHTDMGGKIMSLARVVRTPGEAVAALATQPPTPPSPPGLG